MFKLEGLEDQKVIKVEVKLNKRNSITCFETSQAESQEVDISAK